MTRFPRHIAVCETNCPSGSDLTEFASQTPGNTPVASLRDALSSAVELQRRATGPNLRIRIGVHTGDAVHAAGDYIGITVNQAARIAVRSRCW